MFRPLSAIVLFASLSQPCSAQYFASQSCPSCPGGICPSYQPPPGLQFQQSFSYPQFAPQQYAMPYDYGQQFYRQPVISEYSFAPQYQYPQVNYNYGNQYSSFRSNGCYGSGQRSVRIGVFARYNGR